MVSLLRLPLTEREGWAFVFEHDQAHRRQHPRTISWLLDPMRAVSRPSSKWHLDHQQAHNQMAAKPPPVPAQILLDSSLPLQKAWWEFANHHEHYIHQSG